MKSTLRRTALAASVSLCALTGAAPAHAEGVLDSIQCLARMDYFEARNQTVENQRITVWVLLNQARALHRTPCEAVAHASEGVRDHRGQAMRDRHAAEVAQKVALYAFQHRDKDPTHGQGMYFISFGNLTRPGFKTEFAMMAGDHIVLKETKIIADAPTKVESPTPIARAPQTEPDSRPFIAWVKSWFGSPAPRATQLAQN